MIKLHVDEPAAIPLAVEPSSAVTMTVTEAFIEGGGANIQSNKNATPSSSQVVVTPDAGYDGLAKVTVAAIPPEYIIPSGTKSITENGEDQDVRQYEYVDVNVPGIVPTGTKTITTNGTHDVTDYASASVAVPASAVDSGTKSITANGNGQDVVGYAAVNVNVPNSYAASDEGKVVQSGALVSQSSQTIDTNGTYDTTTKNEVVVNVSGGGRDYALEASLIGKTFTGVYSNSELTIVGVQSFRISGLTGVDLPNCVEVGEAGFRYSGITSINLPKLEKSNTNYGFANCTALVTAVLPSYKTGNLPNTFNGDTSLTGVDLGNPNLTLPSITQQSFSGCTSLKTLILRYSNRVSLGGTNVFNSTPFANGGSGGTIYIPKSLYDHLGDGGSSDYKAATNWSTINGYGTITWAKIEGSQYENAYVDGTPIS